MTSLIGRAPSAFSPVAGAAVAALGAVPAWAVLAAAAERLHVARAVVGQLTGTPDHPADPEVLRLAIAELRDAEQAFGHRRIEAGQPA